MVPNLEPPEPSSHLLAWIAKKPTPVAAAAPTYKPAVDDKPSDRYTEAAFSKELDALRGVREGQRNAALNKSAFSLGQFVGAGTLSRTRVEAALLAAGTALGLPHIEAEKTIRSGIEAGMKQPRQAPAPRETRRTRPKADQVAPAPVYDLETGEVIDASEPVTEQADTPGGVDGAVDPVEMVNEDHALVLAGDKAIILREQPGTDGAIELRFLTIDAFKQWFSNRKILVNDKTVALAKLWLDSPTRRQYSGITFAPEGAPEGYYNLWRGFSVTPQEGNCALFRDHLLTNVCQGSTELYDYVVGWFAQMVREPHKKVGTSIVLRGRQGVGKTIVGEIVGSLFLPHYVQVADPRFITGRFNSHLSSCLLLHADEGFWAGDHAAEGKLKDLVTGSHQLIELKGKEPFKVRNLTRLFVTSNASWVVPAGFEERRFVVLDVGEDHMQDTSYFAKIHAEMENGGRAALLHYLLNFDLSTVNLRAVPNTAALAEQKVETLSPELAWWLDCLRSGRILRDHTAWPSQVECDALFDSYIRHAEKTGVRRRSIETQLGIALKKIAPGMRRRRGTFVVKDSYGHESTQRGYVYELPSLERCRRNFTEKLGYEIDWAEDGINGE